MTFGVISVPVPVPVRTGGLWPAGSDVVATLARHGHPRIPGSRVETDSAVGGRYGAGAVRYAFRGSRRRGQRA